MICNITDDFLKKVYPKIGKEGVWEAYNEFYYKPNKEILNLHFNRWNGFDKEELKNIVNKWSKNEFKNVIKAIERFNFNKVEEVIKRSERVLGKLNNLEIYFIIGDFRSGIYIDQYDNKNIIVIAFEVVSQYGKLEEVILPSISHELFHLYHYSKLNKKNIFRKDSFQKLLIDDGLASYFSYMVNTEYSLEKVLIYTKKQMNMIKKNERRYWQQISQSMKAKSKQECIVLFNAPKKMWKEKLDFIPDWPPRISYYYGFKIIEQYINENGKDYIKKLMLLKPEKIISGSSYLRGLQNQ